VSARSHDDYQENIGPYVLGALPELEVELLERHLAGCESCRADVEDLRVVTGAMARSVPQVEPPPSLKASLMATVNSEASLRAAATAPERGPAPGRRSLRDWIGGMQPRLVGAMAVAVLALGVVIGLAADKITGGGTTARTISASIDRRLMPSGNASLRVMGTDGKLRLIGAPQPPTGRTYQLWYQHGKRIQRGGTFRPKADGSYEADLAVRKGTDAVMVTVERAGGVPAPTGPPVMQFSV
jgi:anti-sigma-K factor RskA